MPKVKQTLFIQSTSGTIENLNNDKHCRVTMTLTFVSANGTYGVTGPITGHENEILEQAIKAASKCIEIEI